MEAAQWAAIGLLAGFTFGSFFYLGSRIDHLAARIDLLSARMDARFDALDGRFDALATRLDEHLDRHAG